MKTNLEKAFEKSLKNYEAPYNPDAWNALSTKIGTATTTGISPVVKWSIATITIAALSIGSYFLFFSKNTITATQQTAQHTSTTETEMNDNIQSTEKEDILLNSKDENHITADKLSNATNNIEKDKTTAVSSNELEQINSVDSKENNSNSDGFSPTDKNEANSEKEHTATPILPLKNNETQYIAGLVSDRVVCSGEQITITNNGTNGELVRFSNNYNWITLESNEKYTFPVYANYEIDFYGKDIPSVVVQVNELPVADFTFTANVFQKGLPVVNCETFGSEGTYEWTFDNETQKKGAKASHHFFKRGEHKIQLTVTDRNGCKQTIVKTIHIKNNYNLLAVDAFKPRGSDSRNTTFMPYSLTERSVKFKLTIIDPIDNGIVFTSKSATNAWNGVDQRTGEVTPSNKVYIWSVQIFNPQPNERPVYSGTVVHN